MKNGELLNTEDAPNNKDVAAYSHFTSLMIFSHTGMPISME